MDHVSLEACIIYTYVVCFLLSSYSYLDVLIRTQRVRWTRSLLCRKQFVSCLQRRHMNVKSFTASHPHAYLKAFSAAHMAERDPNRRLAVVTQWLPYTHAKLCRTPPFLSVAPPCSIRLSAAGRRRMRLRFSGVIGRRLRSTVRSLLFSSAAAGGCPGFRPGVRRGGGGRRSEFTVQLAPMGGSWRCRPLQSKW